MQADTTEAVWLESKREFSLSELVELSGVPEQVLRELVDYGALVPTNPRAAPWTFAAGFVVVVRTARRLREDLELEPQALALALTLVERIRELETELCLLRAQLPRRSP
jgi:chaperone modulatory protein CbpM